MINLCNTLLPNDRVQAIPADIGKTIKPIPVIDKVIEVDVAPMIRILSTDSNFLFRNFLIFVSLFGFMVFVFEICNHFFNVVDVVIETVIIICLFL